MEITLPYLYSATLGLVLILVLSYLLVQNLNFDKRKPPPPPQADGAWPIIGHLRMLRASDQPPYKILGALADKYGPAFTIRLGLNSVLVVSSWELAKECFSTNDKAVSSRPKIVATKHLCYNNTMFGFSPYGSYWREMRKLATLGLLSNRRVELLKDIRVEELQISLKELCEIWNDKKNYSGQILIELNKWLGDLSVDMALKMVVGKRLFNTATVDKDVEEEKRRCQKALMDFLHLLGSFLVSDAIPYTGWLDLGGHEKVMKQTAKELDGFLEGWLKEHKQKRDSGEAKGDEGFMYVLLSLLDGHGGGGIAGYDADTIIKATTLSMIAGAADTTAITLTWAISLLLNNPHTIKKVQEELDVQVGTKRLVDESDISKLVYLQAVIKETLRLYPPGSVQTREFTEDCVIGGYHVRKGTRLMINVNKIQTDPRIWSEPLQFKPERFLTTHQNVDVRGKHYELIPFGSGRRVCPGISFGLQMVHFILASFLQMFDIKNGSNGPVDMSESRGLTNMKTTPLEVLIKPRLSSDVFG